MDTRSLKGRRKITEQLVFSCIPKNTRKKKKKLMGLYELRGTTIKRQRISSGPNAQAIRKSLVPYHPCRQSMPRWRQRRSNHRLTTLEKTVLNTFKLPIMVILSKNIRLLGKWLRRPRSWYCNTDRISWAPLEVEKAFSSRKEFLIFTKFSSSFDQQEWVRISCNSVSYSDYYAVCI